MKWAKKGGKPKFELAELVSSMATMAPYEKSAKKMKKNTSGPWDIWSGNIRHAYPNNSVKFKMQSTPGLDLR